MNRRDFFKIAGASALAFVLRREGSAASQAEKTGKPNIIFILFDDMGYGQPPCYRQGSEFKTPNLDRLAREGMRFTDAHSGAALCTPTRYGVITGRCPSRIGQYGVLTTFSPPIIPKERLTVAGLLKSQGYHTACFGKWHLGMIWPADKAKGKGDTAPVGSVAGDGPTTRGFDVFWGYTHARNIGMIMSQDKVAEHIEPVAVQPMLTKKATAYIDERAAKNEPFFIYMPISPPHTPIVPAPEFAGKSGAKEYGDWLYEGDWAVGQILEALERNKLSDNTLVMVSSDNGAAGRAYQPLRGSKGMIWEGGHREPFLARWPGKIKPGSTCDDIICTNDIMATCADITGVKLPDNAGEDSASILPDLLGKAQGPVHEAVVHQSGGGDLAIRQGQWKLVFLKGGSRELYDLKADIGETKDVGAGNPEVVAKLTKLMQRFIDNGRSTPGAPQKNDVTMSLAGKDRGKKKEAKKKDGKGNDGGNVTDPSFD